MTKKILSFNNLGQLVCVIYTRVSSERQQEKGSSLETQREECEKYAKKNRMIIKDYFGGKFESAKEEGEEFKRMIEMVLKDGEVNVILVYTPNRFSRTSDALATINMLRRHGIYVIAVTQPIDPDTPIGKFMSGLSILGAELDNNERRCAIVSGQHGQLHRGEWPYQIPCGYKRNPELKKEIRIDEAKGELMKQAFLWRAEGVSQVVICERLQAQGLNMRPKRLSKVLKNPFYCGWIIHENLNNSPVKGQHDALIDEDTFFSINPEVRQLIYGMPTKLDSSDEIEGNTSRMIKSTPEYPLKRILHCPYCGKALSGYSTTRRDKEHHYYKCSTKGCGINLRADEMHQMFDDLIGQYQVYPQYVPLLKKILQNEVHTRLDESIKYLPQLRKRYSEHQKLKKNVELNYAKGKISDDIYREALSQEIKNMTVLEKQMYVAENAERESEKMEQYVIEMSHCLEGLLSETDYMNRLRLQSQVFPDGLIVDVESEQKSLVVKKSGCIFQKST